MSKPIATACRTPKVAALFMELLDNMPPDTTLFLIAVGPRDEKGGREIVVGGDTDQEAARLAAAEVLNPDSAHATLISKTSMTKDLN